MTSPFTLPCSLTLPSMYADSEELLGKYFKANPEARKKIFLATKYGVKHFDPEGGSVFDSSGAFAKEALEASMKRMGVDFVDLFYMHRANPDTPIEDTMRGLRDLKK